MACEYCDTRSDSFGIEKESTKNFSTAYEECKIVKILKKFDKTEIGKVYLFVSNEDYKYTRINYCPMCGRNLDE